MNKQALYDIAIILVVPAFLVGGFLYAGTESITSIFSLPSIGESALPGQGGEELGTKTKAMLTELNSIHFDESIFTDPLFLSLKDLTEPVSTTTVGREYPFSTPEELRLQMKNTPASVQKGNFSAPEFDALVNKGLR